jgi:hypothetical protein
MLKKISLQKQRLSNEEMIVRRGGALFYNWGSCLEQCWEDCNIDSQIYEGQPAYAGGMAEFPIW